MDTTAYIESGVLELYVAGALTEEENKEVHKLMQQYPEILQEVLTIEAAIVKLTAEASPKRSSGIFDLILSRLGVARDSMREDNNVVSIARPRYTWVTYTGWAAAIMLGLGLLWTLDQNHTIETEMSRVEREKSALELEIENSNKHLVATQNLLNILRDKNMISVPLGGQGEFANSYAKVYWNQEENSIYLDVQGLPDPPEGKVYQVWSLKLNPLTPTSLGTLDDFDSDDNKIFALSNNNVSEAFGITLEPEGGSTAPTMDQLYTLGVVQNSAS